MQLKLETWLILISWLFLVSCGYDPPIMNLTYGYPQCPPFRSYAPHEGPAYKRFYHPSVAAVPQQYGDASRAVYGCGNSIALYRQHLNCQ